MITTSCARCGNVHVPGRREDMPCCAPCEAAIARECALEAAERELHAAALVLGEKFHNETDATWDECQRYERAALMFYRATEATKTGAKK